ncbi:MAG: biopolymer transporter ExbD [Verrucomicrobiota bacterium]
MKFRRTLAEPDETIELNLIPLIDIIMFLLIFFISTTSMMQERGVVVDKPQSAPSAGNSENKSILLAVTPEGKITYDGKEIDLGGVRPTVKRLCAEEALPVVIQVSEKSRSGMMIRVIDEARMGGAKDVSVASQRS